jgi:hypothetical protein
VQRIEMETELRRRREAKPFEPFVIELTNGDRVDVDDPEALGFGGGSAGYITSAGDPIDFDCSEVVRISNRQPVLSP